MAWLEELVERFFAVALAVVLAPFLFASAMCVVLSSPGPALIREPWINPDGAEIDVFKFRTRTITGRKTAVGWFLERYSVAEYPILFNVLRGEVALKDVLMRWSRRR